MINIDYFIRDKNSLAEEEYNRIRLLVIVLLILITITGLLFLLSFFGMFSTITNLSIFLILILTLGIFRQSGNIDVAFFVTTLTCSLFMVWNAAANGYTLSHNNKWFAIAFITIFFMKPSWLTPYAWFLALVQTVFFYLARQELLNSEELSSINEEYIDNLLFFGLCFGLLKLLNNYQIRQNQFILQSNKLLEQRSKELAESNLELEKFALLASHDLKTPLRNIISFTMLLEKDLIKSTNTKALEYLYFIKNGGVKLDKLVNDVLSFSRLSSTSNIKEVVDLNDLIRRHPLT